MQKRSCEGKKKSLRHAADREGVTRRPSLEDVTQSIASPKPRFSETDFHQTIFDESMSHRNSSQTDERSFEKGGSLFGKRSSAEARVSSVEPDRSKSSASPSAESPNACRILLIEDDPNLGPGLKTFFSSKGYEVTWTEEGTDVPSLVASISPDLVLLDLRRPQKNGFEVLQEMEEEGTNVPVLILTALQGDAYEHRCRQLGAVGYYQKPFDLKRLVKRVEELSECARSAESK